METNPKQKLGTTIAKIVYHAVSRYQATFDYMHTTVEKLAELEAYDVKDEVQRYRFNAGKKKVTIDVTLDPYVVDVDITVFDPYEIYSAKQIPFHRKYALIVGESSEE